jgi:CheY-like chemotaxis protein
VVKDTGHGIPHDKLDRIFETFTQAGDSESPYARQFEGAGLGLPLVKRLVELLGGNMSLDSWPDKGTTAYVSLPFRMPRDLVERPHDHVGDVPVGDSQKLRVLVVDDDEATRLHIQRLLEKQKLSVHVAENGEKALYALVQDGFDCILMDIQMPVLDGVAATKRIRASASKKRDIPIIAMTAYAMKGDQDKFLEAGMNDYITKPVDKNDLLKVLKRNLTD